MMRILGIDYGDARVGVAVSDPMGFTAQGVKTLNNKVFDKMMQSLKEIIDEYNPEKIIVGLPKNMDGSIGFRGEITKDFCEKLSGITTAQIILLDERLTTVTADRYLSATNTRGKDRKKVVDTVAACIILQDYLDSNK
ncbi:MAG: Holliday junction resolvase RuvX [Ruminococcaceae bacterium]|nr:Holliday junction resolvase RuvX [Oscillospiraceae bacterium]